VGVVGSRGLACVIDFLGGCGKKGLEGIGVRWMMDSISVDVGLERSDGFERGLSNYANVRRWGDGGGVSRSMKSLEMERMMGTVGLVVWVW
jgi:hypothetical protein